MRSLPSISLLQSRFQYDPESGQIFRRDSGLPVTNTCHGYLRVRFKVDGVIFAIAAHRVAWALHYGAWPESQIDHINGVRSDNRLCNLRQATHEQNQWNRAGHKDRKHSPYPGVQLLPSGKWRGIIMVSGNRKHLGVFESADLAHMAYQKASREMRGAYSRI